MFPLRYFGAYLAARYWPETGVPAAAATPALNIFRLDQSSASANVLRVHQGGASAHVFGVDQASAAANVFRIDQSGSGKLFR